MDCNEFKQHMFLFLDGEISMDEESEFFEHADSCNQCALELEKEQRLHHVVRQKLRPKPAPVDLRRDIIRSMKKAKRPRWLRYSYSSIAAAAAAILLVFVWSPHQDGKIPTTIQAAMARQVDDSLPLDVATADPLDLKQFFKLRLPFSFSVPQELSPYKVRGARMAYLGYAPTAVVRYEIDGDAALLYVFRDAPTRDFLSSAGNGVGEFRIPDSNRHAIAWQANGVVYSLIGERNDKLLRELRNRLHSQQRPR